MTERHRAQSLRVLGLSNALLAGERLVFLQVLEEYGEELLLRDVGIDLASGIGVDLGLQGVLQTIARGSISL